MMEELTKLENIVRAVATYSAVPTVAMRAAISADLLLWGARERFEQYASFLGRKVEWRDTLEQGEVWCDQGMVSEAMDALLRNALDFSPDDGVSVYLVGRFKKNGWKLTVSDKGSGISPGDLPFVFDPFFTTKAQGVGMGLSLAKRIAVEHHGKLELKSTPVRGTVVTLHLPQRKSWPGKCPRA